VKTFAPVQIPKPIADIVRRRMRPLVRLYWQRQGCMSLDDLAFSAYTQAVHDCAHLNQSGQMPQPDEIKP
jgi:hypothetical protein